MNRFLQFSILIMLLTACRKEENNNGQQIPAGSCLQIKILNTSFSANLQAVFFIDENDGFVSGANGELYKTANGGNSWDTLNTHTTLPIYDICFLDPLKGFAVGGEHACGGTGCVPAGGFILKTQDGGQTWTKVFTPSAKIEISAVYFVSSNTGFCAGDNMILKTTDGGQTWSEYKINEPEVEMMKITFTDAQHGFIVSLSDKIITTNDGGVSWKVTSPGYQSGYYSLSSPTGSLYVSGQGKIIRSNNGGNSWSLLANSPADIFALYFVDNKVGFAFGRGNYSGGDFGYNYGAVYCTSDGGDHWQGSADIRNFGLVRAVSFPTKQTGYAVSGSQVIKFSSK